MASLPIPAEVRERVVQAAAELYEQGGRQDFPTVDQVRRVARVDMNAASTIMREWRRAQTARAAPMAVTVPEAVAQANNAALAALWQQAQELANTSLRTAQAAWQSERGELDAIRQELADAYEQQAAELDRAHKDMDRVRAAHTAAVGELERVRGEWVRVQAVADAQEAARQEQRKTMAQEAVRQVERLTKAQAERDEARKAAAAARERAAELGGRLQAVQAHNAELMARTGPRMSTDGGGAKGKTRD